MLKSDLEQDWLISIKHLHGVTFKHMQGYHNQKKHGRRGAQGSVSQDVIKGLGGSAQTYYENLSKAEQTKFRLAWYREIGKNPGANSTQFMVDFEQKRVAAGASPMTQILLNNPVPKTPKAVAHPPPPPPPAPPPPPPAPAVMTLAQAKSWYASLPTQLEKNRFRTAWHHEQKKNPNADYADFATKYQAKKAGQQPAVVPPTPPAAAPKPTPAPATPVASVPQNVPVTAPPPLLKSVAGMKDSMAFQNWHNSLTQSQKVAYKLAWNAKTTRMSQFSFAKQWAKQQQQQAASQPAAPAPAPKAPPPPVQIGVTVNLPGGAKATAIGPAPATPAPALASSSGIVVPNARNYKAWHKGLSIADRLQLNVDLYAYRQANGNITALSFAQKGWAAKANARAQAKATPPPPPPPAPAPKPAPAPTASTSAATPAPAKVTAKTLTQWRLSLTPADRTQYIADLTAHSGGSILSYAQQAKFANQWIKQQAALKTPFSTFSSAQKFVNALTPAQQAQFASALGMSGRITSAHPVSVRKRFIAAAQTFQKNLQAASTTPAPAPAPAPAPKPAAPPPIVSMPLSSSLISTPTARSYQAWYGGMTPVMRKQFRQDLAAYRSSGVFGASVISPLMFAKRWTSGMNQSAGTIDAMLAQGTRVTNVSSIQALHPSMSAGVASLFATLPNAQLQLAFGRDFRAHIAGQNVNPMTFAQDWIKNNVNGSAQQSTPAQPQPAQAGPTGPRPEKTSGKYNKQVSAQELDIQQINQSDKNWIHNYKHANESNKLKMINDANGFNGNPKVVSKTDMDEIVRDGGIEIWRGIGSPSQTNRTTGQSEPAYVKNFMDEPPSYQGAGMFGDGWYTSDTKQILNTSYANPWGMRMALSKNAKLYDYDQLQRDQARDASAVRSGTGKYANLTNRERDNLLDIFGDEGRYASYKGYDAIRVSDPVTKRHAGGIANKYYYVVLNRTAVAITNSFYNKNNGTWTTIQSVLPDAYKEYDRLQSAFARRMEEVWTAR